MSLEKIGRYEIKEQLGRGGMATVYRATDPRFKRDVAIKVLPRELTLDPQFRARFDREAQTIASLEHPAIVPVHDYGEQDGQPYLVMRLMTGGSLADLLMKGPLPTKEISRILERIGSALDFAHETGIIHRDLKPGNILFDQYKDAYLADFGIARLSDSSATLTGSGLVGTPAYMSPEQIEGSALDGRTDIYALGIIVFEMLTGRKPYQADTPAMLLVKQMTEPMPRVRDIDPDLPPGCEEVITRATAKKAVERYAKASHLADTLSSALREELKTAVSSQPRTEPKAPPAVRQRKVPVWLWPALAVVVVVVLAAIFWPRLRPDGSAQPAQSAITPDNVAQMTALHQLGRGSVETAELSPSGELVALGGSSGVWIYEANSLELRQSLTGHTGLVDAVAWSPDNTKLVSASWDGTARIWDVDTGEQITQIPHPDQVIAVAWSVDGQTVATATWGGPILLWDAANGQSIGELAGHTDSVTHLRFSPDGQLLASASPESVRLWEMDSQQEAALLTDSPTEHGNLHWSPDGTRLLVTNYNDSTVQIWQADGTEQAVLAGMEYGVYDAAWSPAGDRILTTSGDGTMRLWDAQNGRLVREVPDNFNSSPIRIIWLDDTRGIFFLDDGTILLADPELREVVARLDQHTTALSQAAFSPDGRFLATANSDGTVRIWDRSGDQLAMLTGHEYGATAVTWSPDGQLLASGGGDGSVRLWDTNRQTQVKEWHHPNDTISALAWQPGSDLIAIGDWAGHIWLWRTGQNTLLADWQAHDGAVTQMAWSPDGTELASGGQDNLVIIWDGQSQTPAQTFSGHTDVVRGVAWSPDGRQLVTVAHDFTVQVRDRASGALTWQQNHQELATAVVWSPDGRFIASGGWNAVINVWDAANGNRLTTLTGHAGPIISLGWSADGSLLASGSEDGTAVLWGVPEE